MPAVVTKDGTLLLIATRARETEVVSQHTLHDTPYSLTILRVSPRLDACQSLIPNSVLAARVPSAFLALKSKHIR